jgi:hypothetical protein
LFGLDFLVRFDQAKMNVAETNKKGQAVHERIKTGNGKRSPT